MAQGGGREEATSSGRRIGVGATDGSGRRGAPERREMRKRGGATRGGFGATATHQQAEEEGGGSGGQVDAGDDEAERGTARRLAEKMEATGQMLTGNARQMGMTTTMATAGRGGRKRIRGCSPAARQRQPAGRRLRQRRTPARRRV
ncbi:hypothetical protein E2562_035768 [Oryza meyeriana var. granulata]|uniref:DUF834 domain-containing protein n=1 Tax=Oryza meyeriana var. granulata TaxID=110450 RepID=A0A6G1FFU3_9ORYZ|nr:hypothetical protein E2562_035768 [Oryza meyeriana var. granulata]